MAKKAVKKSAKRNKTSKVPPFSAYWDKTNYFILFAGIAVLIVGYIFMSMGPWNSFTSLDVSPVLLIIGYAVILPLAILYKKRGGNGPDETTEQTAEKK